MAGSCRVHVTWRCTLGYKS